MKKSIDPHAPHLSGDRALSQGSVPEPDGEEMPLPRSAGERPAAKRHWDAADQTGRGFVKVDDYRFDIPKHGAMRVPGRVICTEKLLNKIDEERVAEQIINVACLPGIVGYSLAMPDAHWGYGAPVGGVAAIDAEAGVISPGMVGYDISCGVRLLRTDLRAQEVRGDIERAMDALYGSVPSGVGSQGAIHLKIREMKKVFESGARWAVGLGYGDREDLETCEDGGFLKEADPDLPSERAMDRGKDQLGTLGSGNHFLELQEVDQVFDPGTAAVFGLFQGQLVVSVHTGSRGCGYQICDDHLRLMQSAARRYGISLPDPQLCCAPIDSDEGKRYFAAMCAGANFARANRQIITHRVRQSFERAFDKTPQELGVRVVYDVCHNIAKMETHDLQGKAIRVLVHRKGATRAFPARHPEVPAPYREVGQPVMVPGSMGTFSFVLVGAPAAMKETFGTTCHGAGRMMSRTKAAKRISGHELAADLKKSGISVRTDSYRGLAEEAPFAYKDVSEVVEACQGSGISRKVARMRPLGVVKG